MSKFYEYELPREQIAQFPAAAAGERTKSRLLRAKRSEGRIEVSDHHVSNLPSILRSGDLLVLNNSKVKPCRFFLSLEGREAELLLVRELSESGKYRALARPMRSFKVGERYQLSPSLTAVAIGREEGNESFLEVQLEKNSAESFEGIISREGLMPIPPYIRGGHAGHIDREYYQTVYATEPGSIAAPTAGLHFTPSLLEELQQRGVRHTFVTLHVGTASFRPAEQQDPNLVEMEREYFKVPPETTELIAETKARGGRIVAVGTTTVRALESWYLDRPSSPEIVRDEGAGYFSSSIMIKPGHRWEVVDLLFTNFHQPGSTHMLLVGGFVGEENVKEIYDHGLRSGYRFLSYGDAMILE